MEEVAMEKVKEDHHYPNKRLRCSNKEENDFVTTTIFQELKDFVQKQQQQPNTTNSLSTINETSDNDYCHNEGFVHPSLQLTNDRSLISTIALPKGTTILEVNVISAPPTLSMSPNNNNNNNDPNLLLLRPSMFYSPISDIELAHYIALRPKQYNSYWNSLPPSLSLSSSLSLDHDVEVEQQQQQQRKETVVGIISLPRLWSNEHVTKLLFGSPLYQQIQNSKHGIETDYVTVMKIVSQQQSPSSSSSSSFVPPYSLEQFSYAMAVVTSRAYSMPCIQQQEQDETGNNINSIGMVPFLDLCNHVRGSSSGDAGDDDQSSLSRKNVSYHFIPSIAKTTRIDKDEPVTISTTDTSSSSSSSSSVLFRAIVQTTQDILPGENLRVTYGAQSNSQLLFNYGFCIPNNIEPDESSNDTYEFIVPKPKSKSILSTVLTKENKQEHDDVNNNSNNHDDDEGVGTTISTSTTTTATTRSVFLRTGPKSYTYLCLSKALELFYPPTTTTVFASSSNQQKQKPEKEQQKGTVEMNNNNNEHPEQEQEQSMMDMEAFLNECEEEDDGEDDDDDDDEGYNEEEEEEIDFGASLDGMDSIMMTMPKPQTKTMEPGTSANTNTNGMTRQGKEASSKSQLERSALDQFQQIIEELACGYSLLSNNNDNNNEDNKIITKEEVDWKKLLQSSKDTERYAAILIHSELRILYFYWHAIESIKTKLVFLASSLSSSSPSSNTITNQSTDKLFVPDVKARVTTTTTPITVKGTTKHDDDNDDDHNNDPTGSLLPPQRRNVTNTPLDSLLLSSNDQIRLESQIQELTLAYIQIRHSELSYSS